jgi:hypothetical protein
MSTQLTMDLSPPMQLVRTEMGLQVRQGGIPANREMPARAPEVLPAVGVCTSVQVRRHPRGGWTIGRRIPGAHAWVYHGYYPSAAAAARAAYAR